MKFYKLLPDCLTIKQSNIEGLGLFSTENINKETNLGITHVKTDKQEFDYGFIRTPLGGFFSLLILNVEGGSYPFSIITGIKPSLIKSPLL